MNPEQRVLLDVAKTSLGSLPVSGQIEAFNHLDSTTRALIVSGALQRMSDKDRRALFEILPPGLATDSRPSTATLTLESRPQTYPDSRSGFGPHKAVDFKVALDNEIPVSDLLVGLLGKAEATLLISDWGNRVDLSTNAPKVSEAVLFSDSNNKARNRDFAVSDAKTTQGEDFKEAGLIFADDAQATIVCATLVKKAKDVGLDLSQSATSWKEQQSEAVSKLSEPELELLSMLRVGVVRSRSGALDVDDDGRLRAGDYYVHSDPTGWAFGASPSAESK